MLLNAQVINWEHFSEGFLNMNVYNRLHLRTRSEGGYNLTLYSNNDSVIYNCIKKNNRKMSIDELSATINSIVPDNFTGILCEVSCKDSHNNYIAYEDIARKSMKNFAESPSDAFFLLGSGSQVIITTFYNKKTETVYISVIFIKTESDKLPVPTKG